VNKIIEIEDKECETYYGNYSEYVRQKEENLLIQYNDYKQQQKKINAMEQTIKDLRDWAIKGGNDKFFRRAASMQIRLNKMERIERPVFDKPNIKLDLKASDRSGKLVIKASDISKSFEDKTIFQQAELLVQYGEKAALIGPNGSGKTTFLKMLFGEISPDNGEVSLGASVKMAYLPQNIAFENEELTILEYFRDDIAILEGKAREHMAKFMFYGGNVFKKIKHLSGGEKVRLKLSKLLFEDVNLLILDEPTNHLDTASIESIEEALSDFRGTVFFISHDRYFINKISKRVIAIEDYKFTSYLGNYDFYKREKEKHAAAGVQSMSPPQVEIVQKQEKSRKPGDSNSRTEKTVKSDSDLANLELRMKTVEAELKEIESSMEAAGSDYEELSRLYQRKTELNGELDILLQEWVH
jgi:ATPase subunit of ABC transporter with duplicated ATPase domains